MSTSIHNVPDIGTVVFDFLSFGLLVQIMESVQDLDEKQRPQTFTERVLSASIEEPELKPEDVSKFSQETLRSLIELAVDKGKIRDEFDKTSYDLPYPERFYQALSVYIEDAIQSIRGALSQFANAIAQHQTVLNQSIANFTQPLIQQLNQVQVDIDRSLVSFGQIIKQYHDQNEIASKEISGLLVQAGFWFPPSGSFELIRAIRELKSQQQATPENVRKVVVEYYEQDDYSNLRNTVNTWGENPYFANRMHIITDALDAHINGKYTLSIPALLPVVEGILTDLVGRRATREDGGISGWAGTAIDEMYMDSFRESSKDALISFITGSSVFGNVEKAFFTPSAFPAWLTNQGLDGKQILQRHAILHGVQTDYDSKENSLRAFLILDVLFWLKRKEWDKKLQLILDRQK